MFHTPEYCYSNTLVYVGDMGILEKAVKKKRVQKEILTVVAGVGVLGVALLAPNVLGAFKKLGYKPRRSIRFVLFANEENGLRGGNKYAEEAKRKGETHRFALESDAGGFTPRGFSFDSNEINFSKAKAWEPLFKPYLIHYFEKGHGGADIGPLKDNIDVLAGLRPDSQRYFDYHHAANDTFDAVNKRELELGAATMASLVYLFDKYGTN